MSWVLNRQTLEIRYQSAYTYIDKTGKVADAICKRFPDFELSQASVHRTDLVSKKTPADVSYGHASSAVSADMEFLAKDRYLEYCSFLIPMFISEFGVHTLTRVGNRVMFNQEFESSEKVEGFVNRLARKTVVAGSLLAETTEASPLQGRRVSEYIVRLENDKTGILLRMYCGTSGIEFQGPKVEHLQAKLPAPKPVAVLDVDFYTTQPMPVGTFVPDEYVRSNLKMLETWLIPLVSRA